MRRVLIDSAAYYALADGDAVEHARSVAVFEQLAFEHRPLVTTNFIVAETHALVLRRLGRDMAAGILRRIDRSKTTIVRVKWTDEQRAREIITTHDDKDYTLTDATSFAVMERLGITTVFTFDRHFAQYGFTVLGLDEP
jgi:predicted nucleic acid-binding protein